MTETPKTYELTTLEDVWLTFAELPDDRAELMLKEIGDAIRMIGPMAKAAKDLGGQFGCGTIQWVNDTKGYYKATISDEAKTFNMTLEGSL